MNYTRKPSKRQVILEAAARLFRDKGYSATSMRDLAKVVRLNASSLYNHIQSKEDILQEICFSVALRFLDGMTQIERSERSTLDKIRALICLHVEVAYTDITSITSFNDEWRHLQEPYLSEFMQMRKDYEMRFMAILQQGMDSGQIKSIDPPVVFYTILSSVRWLYDWLKKEQDTSCEQLQNHFCEMLLGGITLD